MSQTDPPEVIQGRLGWESGDISEANPEELEPHPKNREIYGDTESPEDLEGVFLESVAEKGVLEPLVVTNGKQIVSGHRRWLAAQEAGLDRVPVRYSEFDSELAEREALIEFNRQREKSPGQVINEFKEMLDIERRHDSTGERTDLIDDEHLGNDSQKSESEHDHFRERAAEKVNANVSGRTLEKGLQVKEIAEGEREAPETVIDEAEEQWQKLEKNDTSYTTAFKELEKAKAESLVNEQEESEFTEKPVIQQTDAVEFLGGLDSADLVIADPPYSTDVEDIAYFAKQWVKPMLDVIGNGGRAFVFIGAYSEELQSYLNVLDAHGAIDRSEVLVWTYKNTLGQTPNHHYKRNWQAVIFIQSDPPQEIDSPKTSEQWAVQEVNAPDARFGERHHKWEKPAELVRRFIRHTTNEGDLVVDPFVGTGTTVLEASEIGRETKGCDIDTEMLEIAEEKGCEVEYE